MRLSESCKEGDEVFAQLPVLEMQCMKKADRNLVKNDGFVENKSEDRDWKAYWWGNFKVLYLRGDWILEKAAGKFVVIVPWIMKDKLAVWTSCSCQQVEC